MKKQNKRDFVVRLRVTKEEYDFLFMKNLLDF